MTLPVVPLSVLLSDPALSACGSQAPSITEIAQSGIQTSLVLMDSCLRQPPEGGGGSEAGGVSLGVVLSGVVVPGVVVSGVVPGAVASDGAVVASGVAVESAGGGAGSVGASLPVA